MRKLLLLTTVLLPLVCVADDFRGAWIASVHNINFPSSQGLSLDGQKAQIIRLLDAAKRCRLNALMVQVRPESDALYPSRIEPWSRYLTGTQGPHPATTHWPSLLVRRRNAESKCMHGLIPIAARRTPAAESGQPCQQALSAVCLPHRQRALDGSGAPAAGKYCQCGP